MIFNMTDLQTAIGIYYEHQEWFRPLFAELDRRGVFYERIDARCHTYNPQDHAERYALVFNRMSASAYLRGNANAILYTHNFLAHLAENNVRVINGRMAFAYETSKALQLELFKRLGINYPRSRVINCARQAVDAAADLSFPVVFKPNIGGRGAGILRFDTPQDLAQAVELNALDLGLDGTALMQEFILKKDDHITRVETLGGKFLYALKISAAGDNFNLCPAEICQVEAATEAAAKMETSAVAATSGAVALGEMCLTDAPKLGLKVEVYTPPPEIIATVENIMRAAQIDVGGIEYMTDARDGTTLFYDINALSNFVADAVNVVGLHPHVNLVDFLLREAGKN